MVEGVVQGSMLQWHCRADTVVHKRGLETREKRVPLLQGLSKEIKVGPLKGLALLQSLIEARLLVFP